MNHFAFARPIAVAPDALMDKLTTSAVLNDGKDELYNRICGVAPGFPEVFASEQARDAALGPFGPYVRFVRATWIEAEIGGFPVSSVAIGHALGEAGFAKVAPPILDAIADRIVDDDGHDIIIHRTRYVMRCQQDGTVRTCHWLTEFDGAGIDRSLGMETALYLDRELNRRLASNSAA